MRTFLFSSLILFSVQALAERSRAIPNEWILTRDSRSETWERIRGANRDIFDMRQVFGPGNKFALVKLRPNRAGVLIPKLGGIRAQPNYIYKYQGIDDPDFSRSWGLENTGQSVPDPSPDGGNSLPPGKSHADIGAVDAWNIFSGAKSTIVATIDSGIDRKHPEIRENLWVNSGEVPGNGIDDDGNGFIDDVNGWNFVTNSSDIHDDGGHGTFVAGVLGAEHNGLGSRGVNARVSIMGLKFSDSLGLGTTESAIRAIQYAVANGARILNMSFGGTAYDPALYEAVRWAGVQGALCVVAAGNAYTNNDIDPEPYYPASFRLPNIISVAAYENNDRKADFSNFGKETVHIAAPGVGIFGLVPGGGHKMGAGTSYAAPYVTGVAALLWGYVPTLSLAGVRERILATSDVMGYYEKNRVQTAGRVNAWNALRDVRPTRPVAPTSWSRKLSSIATGHPYNNYSADTYKVDVPGAKHVRVHFAKFNTEGCCDHVLIRDSTGTEVWRYSGNKGEMTSVDVLGSSLEVRFETDYSTTEYGFDIDYVEASY